MKFILTTHFSNFGLNVFLTLKIMNFKDGPLDQSMELGYQKGPSLFMGESKKK
jgi:hypothetical protein